ncbi:hypothetical protein L596_017347 [Steinernema carpocapsae]|uniref:Uncharacterized protein n=1 Tax=Steinernema carpocapsae TaxID=34508 RepID=A0A4U5N1N3_STECR|nr:hypothetical protein L596_017347 [Steinernema carpocapsae]
MKTWFDVADRYNTILNGMNRSELKTLSFKPKGEEFDTWRKSNLTGRSLSPRRDNEKIEKYLTSATTEETKLQLDFADRFQFLRLRKQIVDSLTAEEAKTLMEEAKNEFGKMTLKYTHETVEAAMKR